ncbi:MAG: hypothetical protein V9G15_05755 [Dermatophilaceae bacterium]
MSAATPTGRPDASSGATPSPARSVRPERPEFSVSAPAPGAVEVPRPAQVSRAMWIGAAGAGGLLLVALMMFIARSHLVAHLSGLLTERDATVSVQAIEDGASKVVLIGAGVLATLGLLEILVVVAFNNRVVGMRALLGLLCVVHALVVGATLLLLPRDSWPAWVATGALAVSVPLVLCALAFSMHPDISPWLKSPHGPGRAHS